MFKRAWICVYQLLQKLVTWFMRTWSLLFVEEGRIGTCHAIHVVTKTILGIQLVLVLWFSHAKNLKQGFMLTLFSLFDLIWGYCAQVKCGTIWGLEVTFFFWSSRFEVIFFFCSKVLRLLERITGNDCWTCWWICGLPNGLTKRAHLLPRACDRFHNIKSRVTTHKGENRNCKEKINNKSFYTNR